MTATQHQEIQSQDPVEAARSSSSENPFEGLYSRPTPPSVLPLMIVFGGILGIQGSRAIWDNSLLTHLATGRLIIDSGLPSSNPFLFTGTSFPVPSYLWSIILAVTEVVFGATGIRLLTVAVAGLMGALIVRLATTQADSDFVGEHEDPGLLAVLTTVVLTWFCLTPFISARPHLPGFVLLALALLVWKERRSAWLLLPVFAVWVNIHGTWLYGLAVLGLYVVAEAIDERKLTKRALGLVGAAMAGIVVGGALYPDRFAVVLLPTRQFGNPVEREALSLYNEWRRVQLSDPQMYLLVGLGLIALYGCVRRRRYATTVATVMLVLIGLSSFRLIPIAAIAIAPLASLGLEELRSIRLPSGRAALALTVLGALLLSAGVGLAVRGPAYNLSRYPVDAVDWLEARGLVGGEVRTITHDYVGNYLEWRLGAEANTYVDDRPDAQTFVDYLALLRLRPGWQKVLADAHGDVIIWKTKEPLARKLAKDPHWVKATTQDGFAVYCSKELADRCH